MTGTYDREDNHIVRDSDLPVWENRKKLVQLTLIYSIFILSMAVIIFSNIKLILIDPGALFKYKKEMRSVQQKKTVFLCAV